MTWLIPDRERRETPPEYVAHLNSIGGMNRYDEPNFRIVWGQNETDLVWGEDANGRCGQHVILKHDVPAWVIEAWKPPECFGTPELWYALTWNAETDAPTIGDYPHRGLYEPVPFNLYVKNVICGFVTFDAMPLNHYILDLTIPNLLKEQDVTYAQKKAAIENRMRMERERSARIAYDAYMEAGPAFGGAAGSYESNREAWLSRIAEKQAGMKISRDEVVRRMGLGHVQRRRLIG
jgi:hypothetical protein